MRYSPYTTLNKGEVKALAKKIQGAGYYQRAGHREHSCPRCKASIASYPRIGVTWQAAIQEAIEAHVGSGECDEAAQ